VHDTAVLDLRAIATISFAFQHVVVFLSFLAHAEVSSFSTVCFEVAGMINVICCDEYFLSSFAQPSFVIVDRPDTVIDVSEGA
jgi:hypothetical protein